MLNVSCNGMVEQVNSGARPRQAPVTHWGVPLVVAENFLLPCAVVPPSTPTLCLHLTCHLPLLLVPSAGPNHLASVSGCERGQHLQHQHMGVVEAVGSELPADRGLGAGQEGTCRGTEDGPTPAPVSTTALQPTVPDSVQWAPSISINGFNTIGGQLCFTISPLTCLSCLSSFQKILADGNSTVKELSNGYILYPVILMGHIRTMTHNSDFLFQ